MVVVVALGGWGSGRSTRRREQPIDPGLVVFAWHGRRVEHAVGIVDAEQVADRPLDCPVWRSIDVVEVNEPSLVAMST